MEFSPLQVFKEADGSYNKENINSLTLSQIQDKINTGWGKTGSLTHAKLPRFSDCKFNQIQP